MVAHSHHHHPAAAGRIARVGRWHGCGPFRLHPILTMQQTYRNILVLILGFCGLHMLFKGKVFLIIALTVLLLSAFSPRMAVAIDKGWLWIGRKIGAVNGTILLFVIYYLLLVPIALLSRITGKDELRLKAPERSNFIEQKHSYSADDLKNPW